MTDRPQKPSESETSKEERHMVRFCPRCGSTNLNPLVFYRPSTWKCLECGYEGVFIIGDRELAEKIAAKFTKRPRNNKSHIQTTHN